MILEGFTMKQPSLVNIHQLEVVFPHCYLLFVEHSEAYKKPFVSSHCSIASPRRSTTQLCISFLPQGVQSILWGKTRIATGSAPV